MAIGVYVNLWGGSMVGGVLMKAAIYCRVSTDEQVKGASLDAQVFELNSLADLLHLPIIKTYREEGRTGSDMARESLNLLLSDGAAGVFDILLVYHNDRLSRNVEDVRRIMRELKAVGVEVKFKNISQDLTTPEGLFTLNVMAAASELFIGDLKRKTKSGMAQRKREGTWTGRVNGYFELIDPARGNLWDNIRPRPELNGPLLEMERLRVAGHSYRFIGTTQGIDHKKVKRVLMLWAWLKGQYATRGLEL